MRGMIVPTDRSAQKKFPLVFSIRTPSLLPSYNYGMELNSDEIGRCKREEGFLSNSIQNGNLKLYNPIVYKICINMYIKLYYFTSIYQNNDTI